MIGHNPVRTAHLIVLEHQIETIQWHLKHAEEGANGLPDHWQHYYGEKFADAIADARRLLGEMTE